MDCISSMMLHPLRKSLHQGVHTLSGKIGVLEQHGTHSRNPLKPWCVISSLVCHFQPYGSSFLRGNDFLMARQGAMDHPTVLLLFAIHLPPLKELKEPKSLSQHVFISCNNNTKQVGQSRPVLCLTLSRFDVAHYTLSYHLWQHHEVLWLQKVIDAIGRISEAIRIPT